MINFDDLKSDTECALSLCISFMIEYKSLTKMGVCELADDNVQTNADKYCQKSKNHIYF